MSSEQPIPETFETAFSDPDCLKCLREKLRATSAVVFFSGEDGWRISNFQGDRPSEVAEVDFYCMLSNGVPQTVYAHKDDLVLTDEKSVEEVFSSLKELFCGSSVIAARIQRDELTGVRLATRDISDPFTEAELAMLQCTGDCPDGCESLAGRAFSECGH